MCLSFIWQEILLSWHINPYLWPDLTKVSFHAHNCKAEFSPLLNFYISELTIHVYHCQWFPGLLFLGLVWCAQVVFKWQRCDWTITHLAGNHTTGQKALPSNWLLFVICRAQMGLRWDHLAVSASTHGKNPPLPWLPTTPDLHPYMIICDSGVKTI